MILTGVGLVLTYAVMSETVAAALTDRDPELALTIRPGYAEARTALAERQVAEALTDSEIAAAKTTAMAAATESPAAVAPVRLLGQVQQLSGDDHRAGVLMALVGSRNVRDTKAQLWLFDESLAQRRFDDAYQRADTLLRRRPDMAPLLFPSLVANFDDPAARNALLARLRTGPGWRANFLSGESQGPNSEAIGAWLLTNLISSSAPPTEHEVGVVARKLAEAGKWSQVRELWGRFGAADAPVLNNGDFERPGRDPPFGWRFEDRDGALGAVERLDTGGRALFAQFPTGRSVQLAEILMVAPPGHYRFDGRVRLEEVPSAGVFRWSLTCAGAQSPAMIHDEVSPGGWRRFEAEFDIPAAGCDAQWLRLMGTGGEGYQSARGWFDDLRVARLTPASR